MALNINSRVVLTTSMYFLLSIFLQNSFGQDQQAPLGSNVPIKKESYKSWSLFLVSNQTWLTPESNDKLKDLYGKFQKFGDAIGPEHLAVWFWSDSPDDTTFNDIDVQRSSAFCSLMQIPPSKSPYVIITTDYPGKAQLDSFPNTFNKLDNYRVIQLSGLDATEITEILNVWADNIVLENLDELAADSDDFWQKIYESLRDSIVDVSRRFKITVDAKVFKVEYEPD